VRDLLQEAGRPEDREIKPVHQATKKSQHKTHPTLAFEM